MLNIINIDAKFLVFIFFFNKNEVSMFTLYDSVSIYNLTCTHINSSTNWLTFMFICLN